MMQMGAAKPFLVGVTSDFAAYADGVLQQALDTILGPAGIQYETMPHTGGTGVSQVLDCYDGIIAFNYKFPSSSFEGLQRLQILSRWGVGFDSVDVPACTNADVILAITRDSVARPVAEGILALIFSLAKNLRTLDRNCREGRWHQNSPTLINLEGRVLGSIGLGNIASEMFRLARSLGFGKLLAYSPSSAASQAKNPDVQLCDLDTVLRESDFVTINCPLTAQSRGMIGVRELALMKRSAYLVNTARGAIVDGNALLDALREKKIAGAGLDVFETEPAPRGHPLFDLDNVVVTPHLVARTEECVRNTCLSACNNVLAVAQGRTPPYVANPAVLEKSRTKARLAARRNT